MPLVAHSNLPAFARLADEGYDVIDSDAVSNLTGQPELHIGFLNLMPDAALEATERQFMRLVAAYDQPVTLYVHAFTVAAEGRSEPARGHIESFYEYFSDLRTLGLDAMIITGANPATSDITSEAFWVPMMEIIEWGRKNVSSMLCSCLATHAVLNHYHGVERVRLRQKRWGVYSHHVTGSDHPLVENVASPADGPHSHVFDVSPEQMEQAGCNVLISSKEVGVYLAVTSDPCEFVFFQGHPEYNAISLLKEYKREVTRFIEDERPDYPPYPENYLPAQAKALLEPFKQSVMKAHDRYEAAPEFPEEQLSFYVANTWTEAGKIIYRNWLNALAAGK